MTNKGSPFERSVARALSLWWSGDRDDDLFWRTPTSGARATARGRKGKATRSQTGDLYATDSVGQPLTDLFAWELKRGYNRVSATDLLDRPARAAKQTFQLWLEQAEESRENAGAFAWAVVHRRDQRDALIWLPDWVPYKLCYHGAFKGLRQSSIILDVGCPQGEVCGMRLDDFLAGVKPGHVTALLAELREQAGGCRSTNGTGSAR